MTNYNTSFDGNTTGVQPSDWTGRWNTSGETWAVREKSLNTKGKCLEHTRTTTLRRLLSWNDIDSDSDRDNSEILVRFRTNTVTVTEQFSCVLRGSGTAGAEEAYIFHQPSATAVRISRLVGGTITTIASLTVPVLTANQWYTIRFRVNSTDLKAKMWNSHYDGEEPAAWDIETTDANISSNGWVGIGNTASLGTRDWDDIAVATNGGTAEFSPASSELRLTQSPVLALTTSESDARITQSAILVMTVAPPPARITQATLLTMAIFEAEPRITQVPVLALVEYFADLPITQTAVLVLADQLNCITRWSQVWTITRIDGVKLGFTAHDMPITFFGVVHTPCNSMLASAAEMSTILGSNGNMELSGILSDLGVSRADLYNGLYDNATIESWMVPWSNAGGECPFRVMGGVIGPADFGETSFTQEVLSDGARLQQKGLLETYTPGCRYYFGNQNDSRCPVDLLTLLVSGSVTGIAIPNASTSSTRRIFVDSTRTEPNGYFDNGTITWTSGLNNGVKSEIKSQVDGQFALWETLLHKIALSDTYTMTPGCDKSPAAHLVFNPDMVDFGGFPDVPGNDSILTSPDAKG